MLGTSAIRSAGGAAGYDAKDNYFTDRDAAEASAWTGAGAEILGLTGPVDADIFKGVLDSSLPDGTTIPAGRDGTHQPGMELTFSAPKSVSLLAYIGGDERLLAAHMAAVKSTIA